VCGELITFCAACSTAAERQKDDKRREKNKSLPKFEDSDEMISFTNSKFPLEKGTCRAVCVPCALVLCVVSCADVFPPPRPVRRYAELQDSGVQGRVRDQLLDHLGCMLVLTQQLPLNPVRSYDNHKVELVIELALKKSAIYAFLPINL
jgi:hypothetical protein